MPDVVQELRDRAHDLATGIMMSEVREQVEWRGADEIEHLREFIDDAVKGIKVLRAMCEKAGLEAGREAAQELLDRVPLPGCDICGIR